jgi:hypothetical protein
MERRRKVHTVLTVIGLECDHLKTALRKFRDDIKLDRGV